MDDTQAEISARETISRLAADRNIAGVTNAVRVATEASFAPDGLPLTGRKAAMRREAAPTKLPVVQIPSEMPSVSENPPSSTVAVTELTSAQTAPSAAALLADILMSASSPSALDAGIEAASDDQSATFVPTPLAVSISPTMESIMTTAEDLMSFQQGNFEALMKSGQIWAAGMQDLGRHWAASAQAQMDEAMGTVKAIASVKSMREAVELQSSLAKTSMEKVVSEGGKLTDASLKLAEQTLAPITARLTVAAERFGRAA